MDVLREALERVRARGPQALVTVIHTSGSTPRHPGARMVVGGDGSSYGTIGGGRIELEATELAAKVADGAPATRIRHHLVRDLAMCCGGSMELYVEPVGPSADAMARAVELGRQRRRVRLVTHLDGTPLEVDETQWAADALGRRAPQLEADRFIESLWPGDRVVLFGLGHVARAAGPLVAGLGFELIVCDDNETGALDAAGLLPWASRIVHSFDLRDLARELGGPLGAGDYLIVLTRDHAIDEKVIEQALGLESLGELAYLGLIGSRGKIGRFHKRLSAKGVATPERWARLRAPIGLDIGAETPAEIAVALAAELVQVRRRGAEPAG